MTEVKLYIYDISRGLAKSLSPMFLGKQIDGIWHTAIVVYGNEYFFGSDGIQFCRPGGTVLQQPQEVFDLGKTEVPKEVLDELLADMSRDRFAGQRYNLLRHNCNNFSDELAQFLTGRAIPSHITGLPDEVMSTPFGAQLEQIVGSMQRQLVDTQGYHYSSSGPAPAGSTGASAGASGANSAPSQSAPAAQLPSPVRFAEPPADCAPTAAADAEAEADAEQLPWLDGLGTAEAGAAAESRLVGLLRRTASVGSAGPLAPAQVATRFVAALERLLDAASVESDGVAGRTAELGGRVACNSTGDLLGGGVPAGRLAACARRLLALGGRPGLPEAGGALALNLMLLRPGNESLAFELGCLLADRLQALAVSGAPSSAQLTLARALCAAARDSDQLAQLAALQGLSIGHLAGLCPHVARLHESVVQAQSMQ